MSKTAMAVPKQAACFLAIMQNMQKTDAGSTEAFRRIYDLAPKAGQAGKTGASGHHVRLAMIEALTHPGVAYWVRMNLGLRVARKLAQVTGSERKEQRLNTLLEAFHIAADAWMLNLSLEQAAWRRQHRTHQVNASKQTASQTLAAFPLAVFPGTVELSGNLGVEALDAAFISEREVNQIQQFKAQVIPGFVARIREQREKPGSMWDRDGDAAGNTRWGIP